MHGLVQSAAARAARAAADGAELQAARRECALLRAGPSASLIAWAEALLAEFPPHVQPGSGGQMPGDARVYVMSPGLLRLRAAIQAQHTGPAVKVKRPPPPPPPPPVLTGHVSSFPPY